MTTMTGAQLLVEQLSIHKADRIFGVPGESYLSVLDALYDASSIDFITCRQEGGAAMMAESYGKLTGMPGICMVTRGPGATNASAGVHIAFQDSTPMILFIGQVARSMVEREAFQEIDYRRMFGQMAKWVAQIDDAKRIPEFINRAFQTATSGRPGPVVLALPEDMLSEVVAFTQIMKPFEPSEAAPSFQSLKQVSNLLEKSKKPLIVVGGGGWSEQVRLDLEAFISRENIPVTASFRCQDYINNDHANYVGHVGIGIDVNLAKAIEESDLLIVLGARLGEMTTSGYSLLDLPVPKQKMIHVYPSSEELGRVYQPDVGVVSSMSNFVSALQDMDIVKQQGWTSWTKKLRHQFEAFSKALSHPGDVQMCDVVHHIRQHLPDDTVLSNGAGNYAIWAHRFFSYRQYGNQLAPTCGSMGYGLPAAISASLYNPDRDVVCMAGDGCFMMTCQELATAVQYGLNLIVIVVNNGMFGTIRMHQERKFPGRVSATSLNNPSFAEMAKSFGGFGVCVKQNEDFKTAFNDARKFDGPALIEIILSPEAITPVLTLKDLKLDS